LRLAGLFEEVVGLDPDADMLRNGRAAGETAGVGNARGTPPLDGAVSRWALLGLAG